MMYLAHQFEGYRLHVKDLDHKELLELDPQARSPRMSTRTARAWTPFVGILMDVGDASGAADAWTGDATVRLFGMAVEWRARSHRRCQSSRCRRTHRRLVVARAGLDALGSARR